MCIGLWSVRWCEVVWVVCVCMDGVLWMWWRCCLNDGTSGTGTRRRTKTSARARLVLRKDMLGLMVMWRCWR